MIRNYLLVFFRNLARHRTYTFIDIMGLTVIIVFLLRNIYSYTLILYQSNLLRAKSV